MGSYDRNRRSTFPRVRWVRRSGRRRLNRNWCPGITFRSPGAVRPRRSIGRHQQPRTHTFPHVRLGRVSWCSGTPQGARRQALVAWSFAAFLAMAAVAIVLPVWGKAIAGTVVVVLVACRVLTPRLRIGVSMVGSVGVIAFAVLRPTIVHVRWVDSAGHIRSVLGLSHQALWSWPPEVGQIVLRRVRSSSLDSAELTIDRVLATPGQRVRVADSRSWTCAEPAQHGQPLGPIPRELRLDHLLGPGQFAVIPSLVRWRPDGPEPEAAILNMLARESVVSEDDIPEPVMLIHQSVPPPAVLHE